MVVAVVVDTLDGVFHAAELVAVAVADTITVDLTVDQADKVKAVAKH